MRSHHFNTSGFVLFCSAYTNTNSLYYNLNELFLYLRSFSKELITAHFSHCTYFLVDSNLFETDMIFRFIVLKITMKSKSLIALEGLAFNFHFC